VGRSCVAERLGASRTETSSMELANCLLMVFMLHVMYCFQQQLPRSLSERGHLLSACCVYYVPTGVVTLVIFSEEYNSWLQQQFSARVYIFQKATRNLIRGIGWSIQISQTFFYTLSWTQYNRVPCLVFRAQGDAQFEMKCSGLRRGVLEMPLWDRGIGGPAEP
jgi:hypothetical protein